MSGNWTDEVVVQPPMGQLGDPRRVMRASAGMAVALMLAVASCTSPLRPTPQSGTGFPGAPSGSATGGSVPSSRSPRYEVVASILSTRGTSTPWACDSMLLSLPPAGCSGVPVTGYDFEHLSGVQRLRGTWWTGPLLLVGTWDGDSLTLTRPPVPRRSPQPEPSPPSSCPGRTRPAIKILARRVTREHARFNMLALERCGDRLWVLVAVADEATIAHLRHHFGNHFLVSGWLRRLGSS